MVTIDGTEIVEGTTIDGQEVQEITVDSDIVWEAVTIPDSGVSRWEFEEGSGSTANDSWNENDGTISDATYTTNSAVGDYALDFGTDADFYYAEASSASNLRLNNWSVSIWAYFNGWAAEINGLIIKGPGDATNDNYEIRVTSNGATAAFADGSNFYTTTGNTSLNTGQYYHLVATYDGSTLKIYLDGSEDGSNSVSATPAQTSDSLKIGYEPDNDGDRRHNGLLDDPRVYNKALTATEVSNLYSTGSISG